MSGFPTPFLRWHSCPRAIGGLGMAALLLAAATVRAQAQQADTVRGRVTDAAGAPLAGAIVSAIDSATRATSTAMTPDSGTFVLILAHGSGRVVVTARMVGHVTQQKSIVTGTADALAVAFALKPEARTMEAVRTVARRPRVVRADMADDRGVAAAVALSLPSQADGLQGNLRGDLANALGAVPGAMLVSGGADGMPAFSVFAVPSAYNGITLSGLGFSGSMPRDGFRLDATTSTYDPARGGFAGALLRARMERGTNDVERSFHATIDAPALQANDLGARGSASALPQKVVSGLASGPVIANRLTYAVSGQYQQSVDATPTLFTASPTTLRLLNLHPDSVARLAQASDAAGLPRFGENGRPDFSESRVAARIDVQPPLATGRSTGTSDGYYLQGGWTRRRSGIGLGRWTAATSGEEAAHDDAWMQLTASRYLPKSILNETTIGVRSATDRVTPTMSLPSALVTLATDAGALATVAVGGGSSDRQRHRSWATQLLNQSSWMTTDRRHTMAVTVEATREGASSATDASPGAFTFASLNDFVVGKPASYQRTLGDHVNGDQVLSGALSIGEIYAPSTTFRVQGGVRVERTRFGEDRAVDPRLVSLVGSDGGRAPVGTAVLPMIGFGWTPPLKISRPRGIGTAARSYVAGGYREYAATVPAQTVQALRQMPSELGNRELLCLGASVPSPDWRKYGSGAVTGPMECDGPAAGLANNTSSAASLLSHSFQSYRSRRSSLSANYDITYSIRASVNASFAQNRGLTNPVDLNFAGASQFPLAGENGRPVYVPKTAIDPRTGTAQWLDARRVNGLGHVTEIRSDGLSEARSLRVGMTYVPFLFTPSSYATVGVMYGWQRVRERANGFASTTNGDPRATEWSSSAMPRHMATLSGMLHIERWGDVKLFARAQSGTSYTPMVAGDVNGDGYSNDRAYVFDPARTQDSVVAAGMRGLLASAPRSARDCLTGASGAIAPRNACQGAWSVNSLALALTPESYRIGLGNRGSVTVYVANLLSGLDRWFHGAERVRGWGQMAAPDPVLLTVRGFDQQQGRYVYHVNPRFGQQMTAMRAPFTITLDARFDVGPDRESRAVQQLVAKVPAPLDERAIRDRIGGGTNRLAPVLMLSDSLRLTTLQVDSIDVALKRFAAVQDSIVGATARFLRHRDGVYGDAETRTRWHDAGLAIYRAERDAAVRIAGALDETQMMKILQSPLGQALDTIRRLTDADIAWQYRSPFGSLP